jgi:hypothetical protein
VATFVIAIYLMIDPAKRFPAWPKILESIDMQRVFLVLLSLTISLGVWRLKRMESVIQGWNNEILHADLKNLIEQRLGYIQAEQIAFSAIRESRMRIDFRDYNGAIRAAIECHSAATHSNNNYIAHAFEAMADGLTLARRQGVPILEKDVITVRQIVLDYRSLHSDQRAQRLKAILDEYLS